MAYCLAMMLHHPSRPRASLLGAGLLLFLVAAVAVIAAIGRLGAPASGRVYTVAEVQAGLRQQPAAWAGRTVRLVGVDMMDIGAGCPASAATGSSPATTCPPSDWAYLAPARTPPWSLPQQALVQVGFGAQVAMQQLQQSMAARAGQRVAPPSPLSPLVQASWPNGALLLYVPGAASLTPRKSRPLPAALYDLPLIGAPLARLFPGDAQTVVTVRLTPLARCPARGLMACPDGIVLPS